MAPVSLQTDEGVKLRSDAAKQGARQASTPEADTGGRTTLPAPRLRKSSVRIRLPNDGDWPAIKELVRQHHERTIFSKIPFSDKKYEVLEKEARRPAAHQCLIVAEVRDRLIGMAWFSAGDYVLGDGHALTTVHIIAVDAERSKGYLAARAFMRLTKAIYIWSSEFKSQGVLIYVTTGIKYMAASRMAHSMGFQAIGDSFYKEI